MTAGHATPAGTAAFAALHAEHPQGQHFRTLDGLTVSSLGLGTYLGRDTEQDDTAYKEVALLALGNGVNLLDTAINYRSQRSERALGDALQDLRLLELAREQVVVCTKAGYLPFDGTVPRDRDAYLERTYVKSGLAAPEEIVDGCHCLAPSYLRDQLRRSLRNLRLSAVDVFYLHNPEQQLGAVPRKEFEERLRRAFARCEELCEEGLIGRYGCATWNGFREAQGAAGHLSLHRLWELAYEVAGDGHRFRVVQLPINFAMTEAIALPNQPLGPDRPPATLVEAAAELGVAVIASGPLLQGKILGRALPERLRAPFPRLRRDSQRALHFVRSAPGVTAVLCGMKSKQHLQENLEVLAEPPLSPAAFRHNFRE